jgi:hypothetical protein
VTADTFKEPTQREDAKKIIKKLFEDRYTSGKNKWFFQPLRVCYLVYFEMYMYTESDILFSSERFLYLYAHKRPLYALTTMLFYALYISYDTFQGTMV